MPGEIAHGLAVDAGEGASYIQDAAETREGHDPTLAINHSDAMPCIAFPGSKTAVQSHKSVGGIWSSKSVGGIWDMEQQDCLTERVLHTVAEVKRRPYSRRSLYRSIFPKSSHNVFSFF